MNYHVLQSSRGDRVNVVFHISVPDEDNAVAVNLRSAVSQFLSGQGTVSQVPWLETNNPTEYAQIQNGEIYEHSTVVQYDTNLADGDKRTEMDNKYIALVAMIQNEIRERFKFWGLDRDVV